MTSRSGNEGRFQAFGPSANAVSRTALILLPAAALAALYLTHAAAVSEYATGSNRAPVQPLPFSHRHHASELGIDCRYCHASVEKSAFVDLPPTHTCMSCHSQVWEQAAALEPLRKSFREGIPVPWVRVNDLPGYVYFDHGRHVRQGVGCAVCHGRVDEMAAVRNVNAFTMRWCLDCHRDPAPSLRPRSEVFNMAWRPAGDALAQGRKLMSLYRINPQRMTDCTVCHR